MLRFLSISVPAITRLLWMFLPLELLQNIGFTLVSLIVKRAWILTEWKNPRYSIICCNRYSVKTGDLLLDFRQFFQVVIYFGMFYSLGHQSNFLRWHSLESNCILNFSTRIFYRGVPNFATDRHCGKSENVFHCFYFGFYIHIYTYLNSSWYMYIKKLFALFSFLNLFFVFTCTLVLTFPQTLS